MRLGLRNKDSGFTALVLCSYALFDWRVLYRPSVPMLAFIRWCWNMTPRGSITRASARGPSIIPFTLWSDIVSLGSNWSCIYHTSTSTSFGECLLLLSAVSSGRQHPSYDVCLDVRGAELQLLSDNLNGVWRLFYSGRGTMVLCDSL